MIIDSKSKGKEALHPMTASTRVARLVSRIVAVGAVTLATLLVAELLMRLFLPVPHPYPPNNAKFNRYVSWDRGLETMIFHPTKASLHGLADEVSFEVNEFGYRSTDLQSLEKPEGQRRIFVVGGSTTENLYLNESESWPGILQERLGEHLEGVVVINAGHSGHNTRDHLALLSQRILAFEPDVVVFLVGINDLTLRTRMDYSILRTDAISYREFYQFAGLKALQAGLAQYSHLVRLIILTKRSLSEEDKGRGPTQDAYGAWIGQMRDIRKSLPMTELDLERYDTTEFMRNLKSLVAITRAAGAEPVLLTQPVLWGGQGIEELLWVTPTRDQAASAAQLNELMARFNDVTRQIASENGVHLVDLAQRVPKIRENFIDDDHYTIAGSRLIGEILSKNLLESGWTKRHLPSN